MGPEQASQLPRSKKAAAPTQVLRPLLVSATTRVALALLFISRDRHRLQGWWNQPQGDRQVVEPVGQWFIHNAPLTGQPHGESILQCFIQIIARCPVLRMLLILQIRAILTRIKP